MGAEQSSSRSDNSNKQKLSKGEVDRLLQQQRVVYEQKYAELLRIAKSQQQNSTTAQQTAREEARKEVERLMHEQLGHLLPQNPQLLDQFSMSQGADVASGVTGRPPAPYPTAGIAQAKLAKETKLYPNLNNPTLHNMRTWTNSSVKTSNNSIPPLMASYPSTSVDRPQPACIQKPTAPAAPLRDRSISRNRKGNEDEELNCPTCKNRYNGNIYQCSKGHSSCSNCKLNSRACGAWVNRRIGICAQPISDMRNITLEAYMNERKIHCPNSEEGCTLYIKLADMESHVKECPFREMSCPLHSIFGQCNWSGKLPKLAGHFDQVHQLHRQGNVDTELVLVNPTDSSHTVYLVVIGNFNFLFHAKVAPADGKLFFAVTLLGTEHSACKWTYEIHLYNKRQPRRKYHYTDICRSEIACIDNLITNSECAAIPLEYANTFVNDHCLTYKFYIKKEFEARNNFGNNIRGRGRFRRGA